MTCIPLGFSRHFGGHFLPASADTFRFEKNKKELCEGKTTGL
jgi:hypothetical protein